MSHQHQWYVSAYLLLGLPTADGVSERYVQWHCTTCPQFCVITGAVTHGTPLHDPDYWSHVTQTAAYHRTGFAEEAARQGHWRPR
jgi:hypothetical protein